MACAEHWGSLEVQPASHARERPIGSAKEGRLCNVGDPAEATSVHTRGVAESRSSEGVISDRHTNACSGRTEQRGAHCLSSVQDLRRVATRGHICLTIEALKVQKLEHVTRVFDVPYCLARLVILYHNKVVSMSL